MIKDKLIKIESTVIPLDMENVDTDQIIPARFLKATSREGFGENLFRDWRYDQEGSIKKDFVLNQNTYNGMILIAGYNFGSGSSREHAAWALKDYGFKAVVSSFFADIFKNNSLNNGLLTVQVTPEFLKNILNEVKMYPGTKFVIDLDSQTISIPEKRLSQKFDINPYKKTCIMNGYDDVDYLISMKDNTLDFERTRSNDFSM